VTPPTLAVDAGQTETRAALFSGGDSRVAAAPGVLRIDGAGGGDAVAEALLRAVAGLDELPPAPIVGVGLSGFEAARESELRQLADRLAREVDATRVAIASDGVTSLLGALGDRPGAVVAAGTGSVVVAHDGERWAKVDGWGSLLGDAGSGFAIGRAGLDVALREHDGRGGSDRLREAAERAFGPLDELSRRVHRSESPSRAVAAFAMQVASLAATGDPVSTRILDGAGRELAISVSAALRRLFTPGEPVSVSYTGNLFGAGAALLLPLSRELSLRCPEATLVEPRSDALAGAAILAERAETLPSQPGLVL
jgi:N-acetylglucosamine kinase-like BadF-type ATPase